VTRAFSCALVVSLLLVAGAGAQSPPPAPTAYFNDYAGVVPAPDAARLEAKLKRFADETSTQVVVAVFPKLPSESLEDFTIRAAQAWGAGRKDWDNGAVFFVFVADRKMRIETGYGLEGALPDQLAARILDGEVRPRFRAGDWAGGLEAGIDAIIAATRGEYKAPPVAQRREGGPPLVAVVIFVFFFVLIVWLAAQGGPYMSAGRTYSRRGPRRDSSHWGGGGWTSGWGGGGGGGSFGGGGFSGGGGGFGGGGASSSW
jgi:uncharacterized protein